MAVIQAVNGREIRVPVGVLIFNLNVLLTFTATRFVQFLRSNETNVLCGEERDVNAIVRVITARTKSSYLLHILFRNKLSVTLVRCGFMHFVSSVGKPHLL